MQFTGTWSFLIALMSTGITENKTGTGYVMYKYIYEINVMNPNPRALDVLTFVGSVKVN